MPTGSKKLTMLNVVPLKESIQTLLEKEGKYAPVATLCKAYLKKLDEGMHEEEICGRFVEALQPVAIHESSKDILFNLGQSINEHKRDLEIVNNLYSMQKGQYSYVVPMVESCTVDYLVDKNASTRNALRQKLSLFEGIKEINSILESLSFDEYEEKTNKPLKNSSLNEAMLPKEKTYTEEEVSKLLETQKQEIEAKTNESTKSSKTTADIDSHINLDGTIKKILVKEGKNEGLKTFCSQYQTALNNGKAEETLYESFISGISKWNHLDAVDTEISALKDRIQKYKQDVDLKKILRIMESTGSYYIVPLIEGCVADYVENKNMQNKAILKQRLQAFEYDPFVRDILNVVMNDQSIESTVYLGESLEKLNSIAHTEKVFSPVKYIKENECVFNVKGTYYNRKGNTITKLSKSSIVNLDESFKTLCNLVNHPAVKINDLDNTISIYEGADSAKIGETFIEINNKPVTGPELDNIASNSHLMNEHKEGFYAAIKMINEKFNEIAYIDFVKRVALNESDDKSVDVFRIKNNLFVTTTDKRLGTSTFYRNVNPIQCRSYINEHMAINVSPFFEDILPNQHAICEGIEEAKKEYETYIEELKNKKEEFERMKDESDGADADIDKAIKLIDDEIADMEKDYDKYKKDSEEFIKGDDTDKSTDTTAPGDNSDDDQDDDTTDDTGSETDDDKPTETPAEMEEPLTEPSSEEEPDELDQEVANVQADADADQAAIDSATPFDPDFDTIATRDDSIDSDDDFSDDTTASSSTDSSKADVKVLRVTYDENVKSGTKQNRGTAYVVIPSVDANGDIKDETKSVTFYLDSDRKPIINNDYMPLVIYNAIVDAIAEDPDTQSIDVSTVAGPEDADSAENADGDTEVVATVSTPDETITKEMDIPDSSFSSLDNPFDDDSTDDTSTSDDTEDMYGLEPEDGDDAGDDQMTSNDASTDSSIDFNTDDFGSEDDAEGMSDDDLDSLIDNPFDSSTDASFGDDDSDDTPVDDVEQEGPAETEERSEKPMYPIEVGLNTNDIKPISKRRFTEALKEMGIQCSQVEGDSDSVVMNFRNKAEVFALHDYFKDWKNYSKAEFCTFFPELKKCFDNRPDVPMQKVSEGVSILGVTAINESRLAADHPYGKIKIALPYTETYAKMFGYPTKLAKNGRPTNICLETESINEAKVVYKKLAAYKAIVGKRIDEDANAFLNRYAKDFDDVSESTVYRINVPYNAFLAQKLDIKDISNAKVDETLGISLHKEDFPTAKKIFEGFYGEKTPISVKRFLNEGLKITVRDDKSGKTIEFDTDDLTSGGKEKEDDEDHFTDSFKGTTFSNDNSSLFNADDADADDDKDKDKDASANGANESEETDQDASANIDEDEEQLKDIDGSETDDEKKDDKPAPKKRFMFRKKKKDTNESVKTSTKLKAINESSVYTGKAPNVLDWVKLKNGKTGQVLSTLPMSENLIVNVDGHTVEVSPNQLDLLTKKSDIVENPYKYDKKTLKGLFEHMVKCGMFMNGIQLTPNDCYVKYGEYINAKQNDKIKLVVEGETVMADKKYIQVTEDLNDFALPKGYISAAEISDNGTKLRDILVNVDDFNSSSEVVGALVQDPDTGEYEPIQVLRSAVSVDAL